MYCLIENESVSRTLEDVADWLLEKPNKDVSKDEINRLKALSEKILDCQHEFDSIVEHYWARMAEKDEQEEKEREEKEKENLLSLSKEELVEKLMAKQES